MKKKNVGPVPKKKRSQKLPMINLKSNKAKFQSCSKIPSELQLLDVYLYFNQMSENKSAIEKYDFVKMFGEFHISKEQAEKIFDEMVAKKAKKVIEFEDFLKITCGSFNEEQIFQIRKKLKKIKNNLLFLYY